MRSTIVNNELAIPLGNKNDLHSNLLPCLALPDTVDWCTSRAMEYGTHGALQWLESMYNVLLPTDRPRLISLWLGNLFRG